MFRNIVDLIQIVLSIDLEFSTENIKKDLYVICTCIVAHVYD